MIMIGNTLALTAQGNVSLSSCGICLKDEVLIKYMHWPNLWIQADLVLWLSIHTLPLVQDGKTASISNLNTTEISCELASIYLHRFCGTGKSNTPFGTADGPTV